MPEFKEESNLSGDSNKTVVEPQAENVQDKREDNEANIRNEHVRYALKRGRTPMKKKPAISSASSVGEISVNAVCNDAIGVGGSNGAQSNIQKSTIIIEKNEMTKKQDDIKKCCVNKPLKSKSSSKIDETLSAKHQKACRSGFSCKICKYVKKILRFLGLIKKCDKCEVSTRQYRHRNYSQRRRRPQNNNRQYTNTRPS